ncbi:MAG TPA: DUF3526 domain-containing protein [Lacunisphaera sp.]|nr:DUF3526 domain-containing protein [Lacunisphaera sp.]
MASVLPIALAEWRLIARHRSTWLLFALFVVLIATAAGLNRARQVRDRAQQLDYQRLVRAQWEGQPDRHPHRVSHYGTFAFRPPGPLAAIDPGVESYTGRVQYLEAHRQNAANFAEAGALSSAFRLGELSLAFVLQLVLPLVTIVLGHRALAGEHETGRLRFLLAQGVSQRALAFGKLGGLALALAPFGAAGAVAAVLVALTDLAFAADAAAPARLAVFAAAVLLHSAAWLALTLWVSARAKTSARACAVLVMLWLGSSVVVPRIAAVAAAARHPLPDKSSFTAAVAADTRKLGDAHNPDDPHYAQFKAETLARYGVTRVEDLPVNYAGILMARGEELSAQTFARHFAALGETMQAQADFVNGWGLVAPTLALRALSAAAAGTDLRADLKFQREAEAYRYAFVQQLNGLHRDEVRYDDDKDQKLSADHWKRFPDFRTAPPTLREALTGTGVAWLVLVLWTLVPLVGLARTDLRTA